ncbi:uncharacterized protein DC041_0006394 [Schistosoma bovis]|uniref:Protein lin-37 n=1 Tax=Schistosoma bovis TaxID=6184 RepID=A0A430QLL5_SCHBO|nr:uncharacterized protein DC041_0006394 [Schistosoma bovis]
MAGRRDSSEKEKFRSPFYKVSPNDIKRKKRRVPSEEEETYKGSEELIFTNILESFVIKVFERSVDFGQFSENAPLYPMARSWIRNLNQGDSSSWNDVPNVDDDQEVRYPILTVLLSDHSLPKDI